MDKQQNKFIAVAYKLYTEKDGERELTEIASKENPFAFISGFGIALDEFEKQVEGLPTGAEFDFTIDKKDAYGEFFDERVVELERSVFEIDGKFDDEHVKVNAMLPMQNEQGDQFVARVKDISDDKVTLDLNHPLAGKSLNFVGSITVMPPNRRFPASSSDSAPDAEAVAVAEAEIAKEAAREAVAKTAAADAILNKRIRQ